MKSKWRWKGKDSSVGWWWYGKGVHSKRGAEASWEYDNGCHLMWSTHAFMHITKYELKEQRWIHGEGIKKFLVIK